MISGYSQYKDDFFNKLNPPFQKRKKLLDVGCGDAVDSLILEKEYGVSVTGTDVYEHENIKKFAIPFKKGSIYHLPFGNESFDYLFVHDVLHHIDEPGQRREKHIKGLKELRRICKKHGTVIIVEGNRYNPLFYPHMVKMYGHDHFRQSYFKYILNEVFHNDDVTFKFFEAHLYPRPLLRIFKLYEYIMEHFAPRPLLAYNAAIVHKT